MPTDHLIFIRPYSIAWKDSLFCESFGTLESPVSFSTLAFRSYNKKDLHTLRWERATGTDVVVRIRGSVVPIGRPAPRIRAIVPITTQKHAAHGEKSESLNPLTVFNFLQPTQIKKFFNIDSRRRLYFCPACKYEGDKYESLEPKYAVLEPNEPDSETIFCFVCRDTHLVERCDCTQPGCLGNVISVEYAICCTCGESLI